MNLRFIDKYEKINVVVLPFSFLVWVEKTNAYVGLLACLLTWFFFCGCMNLRVEKACGIDVHKSFLVTSILTSSGDKETKEFNTGLEDLLNLRDWIIESGCQRVALESTGIYWTPIDSEWIAELCLNGQIKPSFVPSREIRELRDLTRTRTKMIQTRTAFKNRKAGVQIL